MILVLFSGLLTACGPKIVSNIIGCNVPPMPDKPTYHSVEWQHKDGLYCTTEDGAKGFIKNKIIQDGYTNDLEIILEGMRTKDDISKKK